MPPSQRDVGIDALRGIVIVLMVLDHTRDFVGSSGMNPRDVTAPALFLTRWITHFCAPVFVLLTGVSAWFYLWQHGSLQKTRRHLLLRGLWLLVLELTLVRFGWTFDWRFNLLILQVIWALGWGMIVLALLVAFPRWILASLGMALIAGHNLLDGISARQFGSAALLWHVLHQPVKDAFFLGTKVMVVYPLVPWVGVMILGFAMAPIFASSKKKPGVLMGMGAIFLALFVALRWSGVYGDPQPWHSYPDVFSNVLSFINCEKYPPSLLYLLMTLGPVFLLYPFMDKIPKTLSSVLATFGQVPLFLYVVHLPLLNLLATALLSFLNLSRSGLPVGFPILAKPASYGLSLPGVYLSCFVVLLCCFPLCKLYAHYKFSRKGILGKLL